MTDYQKAIDLESDEKSIESIKTKLKRVRRMNMKKIIYFNFSRRILISVLFSIFFIFFTVLISSCISVYVNI